MGGGNGKVSWGHFMGCLNSNQEVWTLSLKSWVPLKPFFKIKNMIYSDCVICVYIVFHSHLSWNTRFKMKTIEYFIFASLLMLKCDRFLGSDTLVNFRYVDGEVEKTLRSFYSLQLKPIFSCSVFGRDIEQQISVVFVVNLNMFENIPPPSSQA